MLSLGFAFTEVRILQEEESEGEKEEEDEEEEEEEGVEDKVVEKLRELIHVVEQCLHSNHGMQSTELTQTSTALLETYDSKNHP